MNAHVVIITGKRVICVDELRSASSVGTTARNAGSKIMSGLEKIIPGGVRRNAQGNQGNTNVAN